MKSHLSNKMSKIIFIVLFAILTALSAALMVMHFTVLKPLDMLTGGDILSDIILIVCELCALISCLFMDKKKSALRAVLSFYSIALIFMVLSGLFAMINAIRLGNGGDSTAPMILSVVIAFLPLIFVIPYFVFYVKWSYGYDKKIKGKILGLGITSTLVVLGSEFAGSMSTKFVVADQAHNMLLLFIPLIIIFFNVLVLIFTMVHKFDPNEVRPVKVKKVKEPKPKKIKEPKPVKVKEPKVKKVKEPKPIKVKEPKVKKVKEPLITVSAINEKTAEIPSVNAEEIVSVPEEKKEPVLSAASEVEKVTSKIIEEPKTEPVIEEKPVETIAPQQEITKETTEEIVSTSKVEESGDKPKLVLERHLNNSAKKRSRAILYCFFFGAFGVHRFYVGKIGTGILYIFTFGGFFLGSLCDLILLVFRGFRDKQGYVLRDED